MRKTLTVILLVVTGFLAGCDSSITDVKTFPSPNGKSILVIATELQAANDPTPWWTHVSLKEPTEDFEKIPGNIVTLQGSGQIDAQWDRASSVVTLRIKSAFKDLDKLPSKKQLKGITILFITSTENKPNKTK
jgi:hypothetical protein